MRALALFSCIFLLRAAAPSAEDRPDFSGVWRDAGDGKTAADDIDHRDPGLRISVESRLSARRRAGGFSGGDEYAIDGAEKPSMAGAGRNAWISAFHQGTSLVVQRIVKHGGTLTRARRTVNMDGVSEAAELHRRQ
jgi:hypothetical protein